MGFNRHTAQEIIYGSTWLGGFQFAHLYNEQGYLTLKHLLGHLHKKTITGNQIMIALSYAQLVAGSGRTLLRSCKGSILIPDLWLLHLQREFDRILMDVFEATKPSDTTLEKLNT
eukprot:4634132-Ditylum_brightwellii.AAC.1